ncbi:MAG TPA: transglutaminase domain-containing protein, partial [Caulobacteraceae bacterium]
AGPDHAVTALDLGVPEAATARVEVSDGRITARLRRGPLDAATLGWSATLAPADSPPEASALSPQDAELYLRPAEGLIQVGPRVRELAALWAAGLSDWDAALAFRRRIGASFCLGVVGYESFDARSAMDWVLDHGWFDCVLGSALLVSLCRAHRVPARLVGGYFLYRLGPSNHTWAEVWAPRRGWTAIDLAGWDLSAGDADADWQGAFIGRIDRRMVTERPPRRVMGPMSLRLPAAWRALQRAVDGGLEISVVDAASGRMAFADRICVESESTPALS